MSGGRYVLLILLLAGAVRPATAHNLTVWRGVMQVEPASLSVRITAGSASIAHLDGRSAPHEQGRPTAGQADRFVEFVRSALELFAADGDVVTPRSVSSQWEEPMDGRGYGVLAVFLVYERTPELHFALARLNPQAGFRMSTQLELVSSTGLFPPVTLTSGGNPVPLPLTRVRSGGPRDALVHDMYQWSQGPVADIYTGPESVRLDVAVSLPVLETWLPVRRKVRSRLTPEEARALLDRAGSFLDARVVVTAGGVPIVPTTRKADLFFPGEAGVPAGGRVIGFDSARLVARLEFPVRGRSSLLLRWGLFNTAVVRGRVRHHHGRGADSFDDHLLTALQNTVTIATTGE